MPLISIIIPVKPGLVPAAVTALTGVDRSACLFETLVVEGTNPSRQRNEAVRQARGKIVYFLDDDAMVRPDCLHRLCGHFADPAITAVGGPSLTPATDSLLQRAIGIVLCSLPGAGGVRNRYRSFGTVRQTTERELILCNLAVRRDAFLACNGFDERLYPNEENEFLDRLAASGGRLIHDPFLSVERSQRSTLTAFSRQMFRYGLGRARQTRIAGFTGIVPFAPLFLLGYLVSLPLAPIPFWQTPALIYLAVIAASSLFYSWQARQPLFAPLLLLLFPLLHLSNGAGLLAGFLLPLPAAPCYKDDAVQVRRLHPPGDL